LARSTGRFARAVTALMEEKGEARARRLAATSIEKEIGYPCFSTDRQPRPYRVDDFPESEDPLLAALGPAHAREQRIAPADYAKSSTSRPNAAAPTNLDAARTVASGLDIIQCSTYPRSCDAQHSRGFCPSCTGRRMNATAGAVQPARGSRAARREPATGRTRGSRRTGGAERLDGGRAALEAGQVGGLQQSMHRRSWPTFLSMPPVRAHERAAGATRTCGERHAVGRVADRPRARGFGHGPARGRSAPA